MTYADALARLTARLGPADRVGLLGGDYAVWRRGGDARDRDRLCLAMEDGDLDLLAVVNGRVHQWPIRDEAALDDALAGALALLSAREGGTTQPGG